MATRVDYLSAFLPIYLRTYRIVDLQFVCKNHKIRKRKQKHNGN